MGKRIQKKAKTIYFNAVIRLECLLSLIFHKSVNFIREETAILQGHANLHGFI